jgi:hypothetical protein
VADIPELPAWNDAQSVSLFLAAGFSALVTALAVFHVAIPHGVAAEVASSTGLAGTVIALAVNAWTHRAAHSAVAVAQTKAKASA